VNVNSNHGRSTYSILPLAFRNDGFTTYFREPDMTRQTLESEYIDVLAGSNVRSLGWGAGPSSVFCYTARRSASFSARA